MIELIKILMESLSQALPRIASVRDDKRRRALGAELFLLYVRFNESVIVADRIVGRLEAYVRAAADDLAGGNGYARSSRAGEWLAEDVRKQVVNLARLRGLLTRHSVVLQILEADAFSQLRPLVDGKSSVLTDLLMVLDAGALPLDPSHADLEALRETARRHAGEHFSAELDRAELELSTRLRRGALPLSAPWGSDAHAAVVSYLRDQLPRERIASIRAALVDLRTALEQNFSVTDILLEVGDPRLVAEEY